MRSTPTWMMSGGGNANTLLEGVPSVAILAAVLLIGGIDSMVWGTLVGVAVQLVCVAWPRIRSRDIRAPAFGLSSSAWGAFAHGFALVLVGQAIMGVTTLIDQFFAAGLGEGGISSLGYAARIVGLLIGIVAIPVTRATLPVFSRATVDDVRQSSRSISMGCSTRLAGAAWHSLASSCAVDREVLSSGGLTPMTLSGWQCYCVLAYCTAPYFSSLVFVSPTQVAVAIESYC
jgi:hypothetical protein